MGALTNKTPGTPDFTYLGLLHLEASTQITSLLQKIQDGGGNDTGLEISTTALKYTGNLTLASLTASTLVYLDSNKKLVSLAAGTDGQVLQIASGLPAWVDKFKDMVENISFQDSNTGISAQTYVIELYAAYAYTINQLKVIAGAGTGTVAVQINGTNVTGISAVNVSTSIATGTATAANTVAVGDKVTFVLSSPSGLINLQASIKTTRI